MFIQLSGYKNRKKEEIHIPSSVLHIILPSRSRTITIYFMADYRKETKCLDLSESTSQAAEMALENLEGRKVLAGMAKEMMVVEVAAAAAEGAVDTVTAMVASAATEAAVEAAETGTGMLAAAAAGEMVY